MAKKDSKKGTSKVVNLQGGKTESKENNSKISISDIRDLVKTASNLREGAEHFLCQSMNNLSNMCNEMEVAWDQYEKMSKTNSEVAKSAAAYHLAVAYNSALNLKANCESIIKGNLDVLMKSPEPSQASEESENPTE